MTREWYILLPRAALYPAISISSAMDQYRSRRYHRRWQWPKKKKPHKKNSYMDVVFRLQSLRHGLQIHWILDIVVVLRNLKWCAWKFTERNNRRTTMRETDHLAVNGSKKRPAPLVGIQLFQDQLHLALQIGILRWPIVVIVAFKARYVFEAEPATTLTLWFREMMSNERMFELERIFEHLEVPTILVIQINNWIYSVEHNYTS